MSKSKILVLGAGGPAGILLTRCLDDYFDVYGKDDGEFASHLIEAKPYDKNIDYDLIIPVPDSLVLTYAQMEKTFLPSLNEIILCQDKVECARILGDLAPKTYWVRDTHGAGGKGSQMCSEYLPGRNLATELLFFNGELKGCFQKERVSYQVKERTQVVSGSAAVATCINDVNVLKIAEEAVHKVSKKPHGIFSVDLKESEEGIAKVTEINAGRFVTSSYIFYYQTDYNLPKLMVELALGLEAKPLGNYPEGLSVIRQVDKMPWIGKL